MKLTFTGSDIQADEGRRLISGKILPFGDEIGHTSVGKVKFRAGSVQFEDVKKVKFLLEHDAKKPIGRAQSIMEDDNALYATFKVAATSRGNDALIEASEDLRSGLSVGVEVLDSKQVGNVLEVISARLEEISLVSKAAFSTAAVSEVLASEAEAEEIPTTNESEAPVENTPEVVAPEAETPAVEASRPTVTAMAYTKPRSPINSPATYLEHSVRAKLGDEDSALWVRAASDTTVAEVAGLVPTPQLTTIWDPKTTNVRPAISAIRTAVLPAAGMTFEIPRVKTAPTVAETAEGVAFSDTQLEIEYVSCTVSKFAGMQKFSVEVLDRTSPAFFEELVRLMAGAYAKATDEAALTAIQGGTLDSTTITLPFDGDEFSGFISRGAASIYAATKRFPTGIVLSPSQWANLIALNDSQKRPLFNVAGSPSNAFGAAEPGSPVGNVLGLPIYVDPYQGTTGDDTIMVVNSDSFVWYESAGPLQLRTNIVGTGEVEVGYYGYGSAVTLTAGGAFGFNNAV
jgi:HK97 family phage prohead protease